MLDVRYHRKIAQFKKRMASIGGLLDVVVIVAYINTIAFAFILLVCPPKIALSYVATFGRETVILLLMLPGIASVNDRHKELLNAVANTSKDEPSSDYASPAITASTSTSNFLAYNSNSQLNNNQQQVLRAWEHSTPSTPNSTIDRKENSNKKGDGNNATAAVGEWYVGQTASGKWGGCFVCFHVYAMLIVKVYLSCVLECVYMLYVTTMNLPLSFSALY